MSKKSISSAFMLLLTALIWGLAFVAQSEGMKTLGTYTFFALRSFLALIFISGMTALKKIGKRKANSNLITKNANTQSKKDLIIAGAICGGMYLLCVSEASGVNKGDFYTLISAVFYAVQILTIDIYISKVDAVKLSLTQFSVGFILSSIFMIIFEQLTLTQIKDAIIPILYVGIFSSGIAYTLQITAQKNISPTVAALIMSFESVFAAVFGWIILSQSLSAREIFGCCLMFLAIILSELPIEKTAIAKKIKFKLDKRQNAEV